MPRKANIKAHATAKASAAEFPLSTLLSQALVAFTIELDNEFEHQMPHRTTNHGATPGARLRPWLGSLVLWSTCMQFVGDEGVRVGELEKLARTSTNLPGMERWGYVSVTPAADDTRARPPQKDWVIRATAAGHQAREVWRPLFGMIEQRWRQRFGEDAIDRLRQLLCEIASQLDSTLPSCLPILGYGLFSKPFKSTRRASLQSREAPGAGATDLSLSALLSRVLLAFATDFESESTIALAISANLLRILDVQGVLFRELPMLSGVSRESLDMASGILEKAGLMLVESAPAASRAKIARLTGKGRIAQERYHTLLHAIEERWKTRFGSPALNDLRAALEPLVGDATADGSPLFRCIEPYPEGWRASLPRPQTLPHYPMVLHRGGYPDGS